MPSLRSLGFMMNDPQRGHVALHVLRDLCAPPEPLDGMGVSTAVDGSVLVSRRPGSASGLSLAELVGPLKGRCGLIRLRAAEELRPRGNTTANMGPFRMRHYGGSVVGGPQDADAAAVSRDALLHDLPDFLRRNVYGHSEGEAFFFAVLGWLHQHATLDRGPQGEAIVDGVQTILEKTKEHPRHVSIMTGLEVVIVSNKSNSAILSVDGLSEDAAMQLDPCLVDTSISRQRLRQFKAIFSAGAIAQPMESTPPSDTGVSILSQGTDSATVLNRDLSCRIV
jgi:hypothetical protein